MSKHHIEDIKGIGPKDALVVWLHGDMFVNVHPDVPKCFVRLEHRKVDMKTFVVDVMPI